MPIHSAAMDRNWFSAARHVHALNRSIRRSVQRNGSVCRDICQLDGCNKYGVTCTHDLTRTDPSGRALHLHKLCRNQEPRDRMLSE